MTKRGLHNLPVCYYDRIQRERGGLHSPRSTLCTVNVLYWLLMGPRSLTIWIYTTGAARPLFVPSLDGGNLGSIKERGSPFGPLLVPMANSPPPVRRGILEGLWSVKAWGGVAGCEQTPRWYEIAPCLWCSFESLKTFHAIDLVWSADFLKVLSKWQQIDPLIPLSCEGRDKRRGTTFDCVPLWGWSGINPSSL